MTTFSKPAIDQLSKPRSLREHDICLGGYAALVFSGSIDSLGEVPGEMTADVLFKFALSDPRIDTRDDLARCGSFPFPRWPDDSIAPAPGVCFVLSDVEHPALAPLLELGAVEDEHYVILNRFTSLDGYSPIDDALGDLLGTLEPARAALLLLGFGDQGREIATRLHGRFDVEPARLIVLDHGERSRDRAMGMGCSIAANWRDALDRVGAAIYSPLDSYESLRAVFDEAQGRGLSVIDNLRTHRSNARSHFIRRGCVLLDAAADRAIQTENAQLTARTHGLPIDAVWMRQDLRRFGSTTAPDLHGPYRQPLHDQAAKVDLEQHEPCDGFDETTWIEMNRAFVSLRDHGDLSVFAGRALCADRWPDATGRVFPSTSVRALGATDFERLLARHVHQCEIARPSQSGAQQTVLGVCAAHFAADDPIIEIGSALGGSALLMALATSRGGETIHSIDPDTARRDVMRFAFEREGVAHRLNQIVRTSDEAVTELTHLQGKAGLVFIDGLHTAAQMQRDFENFAPLVKPSGALLVHDATPARSTVLHVVLNSIVRDERFSLQCMVDGLAVFLRR